LANPEILSLLLQCHGRFVSGQEMATALGVSRTSIWKEVNSLRSRGFVIEASSRKGYLLTGCPDILDPTLIRSGLNTERMGREILCYQEVASTNALAREIAETAVDGTVVLSEEQSVGRGRMDRGWSSPPGGIWMSLILKPRIHPMLAPRINICAGIALATSIKDLFGLDARIKWPNDILIGDRKVSGILTEVGADMDQLRYAVVGWGINANVDIEALHPDWNATSLQAELGHSVDRSELIRSILEEMEGFTRALTDEFRPVLDRWRSLSATLGRDVRIITHEEEIIGKAVDVDDKGALLTELPSGEMRRIMAGDCIHLRGLDCFLDGRER